MSGFLYVLKRLALVVAGYLLGLVAGLAGVILFYGILAALPDAPEYFSWVSTGSLLALLWPPVALFAFIVAIYVTALQMLAAAAITELFELRQVWLHMILAALVGLSGFLMIVPMLDGTVSHSDLADLGIITAAAAVAGTVYWLIAGRQAGFKRRVLLYRAASYEAHAVQMDATAGPPTP